jgi:hypothetical protein
MAGPPKSISECGAQQDNSSVKLRSFLPVWQRYATRFFVIPDLIRDPFGAWVGGRPRIRTKVMKRESMRGKNAIPE